MKNKGKVYPSPSPLSPAADALAVLQLLPAAVLALTVVLSLDDRHVLAYMITRSIKSTTPPADNTGGGKNKSFHSHRPPLFDCDCFECYTHFWFKWDSSPNRELIHQAIEAFEDHLNSGEKPSKKSKKRDRTAHRRPVGKTSSPPRELHVATAEVVKTDEEQDGVSEEGTRAPETAAAGHNHHKGLARKVLPDVIGLFNWRLWSLWSPNV